MTAAPQIAAPTAGSPADRAADLLTWLGNLSTSERTALAVDWAGADATKAYTDVAGAATELAYDQDLILGTAGAEYVAGSNPRITLDRVGREHGDHVLDLLMAVLVADQVTGDDYQKMIGWALPYLPRLHDFAPRRPAKVATWAPPVRRPWARPQFKLRLAHLRIVAWLAVAATPVLWFLAAVSLGTGSFGTAGQLLTAGVVILIIGVVCGAVYGFNRTRARTAAAATRRRAAQRQGAAR